MTTPPLTAVAASALLCWAGAVVCCVPVFFLVPVVPFLVPPVPVAVLVWAVLVRAVLVWAWAVLRAVVRSTVTWASRGTPGWVTLEHPGPAAALPVPVSRVTFSAAPACPDPPTAGEVITAMPPTGLVVLPGAGQTRCTEVTAASRVACGADPAVSEMLCRSPASP